MLEGSVPATMKSQKIRVEERDAIEPSMACQDLAEEEMEGVSKFPERIEELKAEAKEMSSGNESSVASIHKYKAVNKNPERKLEGNELSGTSVRGSFIS